MRKKEYLIKPNLSIKEYKVKSFTDITEYSLHVDLGDKITANNFGLSHCCSHSNAMVKSFFIANRLFLFMKDTRTYEYVNKSIGTVLINKTEPIMIDVLLNGKTEILVIENNSAYILNKGIKFTFPYGTKVIKYDGRLFVAKEKNIYYSNEFNFTEYSTNIENVGFLSVAAEDEKVQDLIPFNDCLYVICKKAIYKLTILNGEFSFTKCEINQIDILEGSSKKIGKNIYFISSSRLCVFDGNTVKTIEGEFDRFLDTAKGVATTNEGMYLIAITINSENVYFVYNTFNGKHHYVWVKGAGTVGEAGYVFINKALYRLTYTKNFKMFCWHSKELDFSTPKKKTLMEISINVPTTLEITVEGDFGSKVIKLETGFNVKKLYLTSRLFKFKINANRNKFLIQDLSFKYIVMEG